MMGFRQEPDLGTRVVFRPQVSVYIPGDRTVTTEVSRVLTGRDFGGDPSVTSDLLRPVAPGIRPHCLLRSSTGESTQTLLLDGPYSPTFVLVSPPLFSALDTRTCPLDWRGPDKAGPWCRPGSLEGS